MHRCLQAIPNITGTETQYQEYPLLRGLDHNVVEVAEDVMSGARKEDISDFIEAAISGEALIDYHKEEVIPLLNWAAIQAGEQPKDWVTADRDKAVFSAVISDRTIFVHPYDVNVADDLVTAIELLYQRRASTAKRGQAIVDAMTKILNNDNRWGTDSNDLRRMLNEIIELEAETREGWIAETNEQRENKQQLVASSNNLTPQKSLTNTQNTQNLAEPKSLNKTDNSNQNLTNRNSNQTDYQNNLIANQNNLTSPSQEPGIVINSGTNIAVPGTKTEYAVELEPHLEPSDWFTYRWEIFYDLADLEPEQQQETGLFGQAKYPKYQQFDENRKGRFTTTWQFSGKHTIVVYVYCQGRLRNSHSLTQVVEPIQTIAVEAFERKTPSGLEVDIYLAQLQLKKQILANQGADTQQIEQIEQIEQIITEVESKLAVTTENPQGMGIPLKAVLVPVAQPQAVPLQLYLKPIDDGKWEIVDLTDLQKISTYQGKDQSAAWTNYLKNNPHPAGEMVAELPALESGAAKQIRQGHSDGISELGKVREWFSRLGLLTGLGAITLAIAPVPGSRVVVATLLITSGASGAAAGGLNIADRLEHGNFEWDGETALDLVDIAGGLAVGTGTVLSLGSKAANITKLKDAVLISGGIETGTDFTGGVILSAQHYRRIEEIRNSNLPEEQKNAQIQQELFNAAGTGGLILLGTVVPGRVKGKKGDFLDIDSSGFSTSGKGSLSISAEELKELRAVGLSNDEFRQLQDPNLSKTDKDALIARHQTAFADLTNNFERSTLEVLIQKLGGKGLRQIYSAASNDGLRKVIDILELEQQGLIKGFDDWVSFLNQGNKDNTNISEVFGELSVAKQIAGELKPGEIVNVGGDARAGTKEGGGQNKSFDITVENQHTGEIFRNIEVETVQGMVADATELESGVGHAASKAVKNTSGTIEAAIRIELPQPGSRIVDRQTGKIKYFGTNGRYTEIDPNTQTTDRTGRDTFAGEKSIFKGLQLRLSRSSDSMLAKVDRVIVINKSGTTVAIVNSQTNGIWKLENIR